MLGFGTFSVSQQDHTKKVHHLAIGFFSGAHSNLITYAFISTRGNKVIGAQVVRKEMFMYAALGHWPSFVNPNRENLFAKNGIDSCFLLTDENDKVVDYDCAPFGELWKIRFKEHPYQHGIVGWGQGEYKPSEAQLVYLEQKYGIKNILTEYIYGDSLFELLRNVQDVDWINNYRSITAP